LVREFTKRQLETAKRNRNKLARALRAAPRAPPQTGLLGKAFNVLRSNPEPIIDASQYGLSPRGVFELADRVMRLEEEGQRIIPRAIIKDTLIDASPSIDEIEGLIMSAGEEEFLDQELVDALLTEIETGRDVIRRSGQFSRANLVGRLTQNLPKPIKRTRKKTKTDKNMSKALRMSNERFRTSKGKLRKGATQAQIMKYAHKLLKRMS